MDDITELIKKEQDACSGSQMNMVILNNRNSILLFRFRIKNVNYGNIYIYSWEKKSMID